MGSDLTPDRLVVRDLGPRRYRSPLRLAELAAECERVFVRDDQRIPVALHAGTVGFEKAGPREYLYFDPRRTRAAIATCGGLCPGLNNVIRSLVLQLHHGYGVAEVWGIRYGYQGLNPANGFEPILLTPAVVSDIHKHGGTILGSSRGPVPPEVAVDYLQARAIDILFCVGGDGTQRGAHALSAEASRRGYALSVVGVPKTIDNDINFVWRSFGFDTAIEKAAGVIECAHNEARAHFNGIGLVKLMGRHAGFIALGATLASQEVNFVLIPEFPFDLEGPGGFLEALRARLQQRQHAVVVVAEGAGQDLMGPGSGERDASGNPRLQDFGVFLRDRIRSYLKQAGVPHDLKYIDPSYYIRSAPANNADALLCDQLARKAAHAAMAGKTDMMIGVWFNCATHVPIELAVERKKQVTAENELWHLALQVTGQAARFRNG